MLKKLTTTLVAATALVGVSATAPTPAQAHPALLGIGLAHHALFHGAFFGGWFWPFLGGIGAGSLLGGLFHPTPAVAAPTYISPPVAEPAVSYAPVHHYRTHYHTSGCRC